MRALGNWEQVTRQVPGTRGTDIGLVERAPSLTITGHWLLKETMDESSLRQWVRRLVGYLSRPEST